MEQMRERVARAIAPFLEGGREFDKMPVNRLQLREWARQAMCGFNDATQDDAYEAADALQPEIDRRVAEEKAKLLEALRVPSVRMGDAGRQILTHDGWNAEAAFKAMLAQYEKENSECPSCGGLNLSCPDGCGRDPITGELNFTMLENPDEQG